MAIFSRILSIADRLQKTQTTLFRKEETSQLETAVENVFKKLHIPQESMRDGLKRSPATA